MSSPTILSLFDHPETWSTDPAKAFDAFILSPRFQELSQRAPRKSKIDGSIEPPHPLRASSVKVYTAMFAKYLRWLAERDIAMLRITSAELMAFLEHGEVVNGKLEQERSSRIRQKYLSLLDRIYKHLDVQPNPAQHVCFDLFQSGDRSKIGRDATMAVLSDAQQAAFLGALPSGEGWKRHRDRAMQCVMLGAGLKVSEVVGMYTANIGEKDSTGSIPIAISPASVGGTARWHQTQLRPFVVAELQTWIEERTALAIPGPLLFPATLRGGRLDNATVYRQVKATFARAGVTVPRRGGRTLRNSFAARELIAGESIELVGEFMGHRRRRSTEAYVPDGSASPWDAEPQS